MASDRFAKKEFVFDLDASHIEKVSDAIVHAELAGELGGVLVFNGILAFESAGKIHRHEPAGDITGEAEKFAERGEDRLTPPVRARAEFLEPLAYAAAMVPFFVLDLIDARAFGRSSKAFPVPAIGVGRGDLAGISVLQYANETSTGAGWIHP